MCFDLDYSRVIYPTINGNILLAFWGTVGISSFDRFFFDLADLGLFLVPKITDQASSVPDLDKLLHCQLGAAVGNHRALPLHTFYLG